MSKIIYIYARNSLPVSIEKHLYEICKALAPDNIIPSSPQVELKDHVAYGIMNPTSSILTKGNSVLIGQLFGKNVNWTELPYDHIDGSYAIFRDNNEVFEVMSDAAGSRKIWYYMNKELFIASTSQRAIIMFLGDFVFDKRVIPWMLSSGCLGQDFSWDKRIKSVLADSSIILNKKEWTLSERTNPVEFSVSDQSEHQHEQLLIESLKNIFESLDLDFSRWGLPLSGGYDSRGMLCFLKKHHKNINGLRTLTWGLKSSLDSKKSDAYVAKNVADILKIPHKYYHTDVCKKDRIEKTIERFLLLGEGRVDCITGYMDGFKMWKTLFENGFEGIIRGDEGFGRYKVSYASSARRVSGCSLCSDYSNLKNYKDYGFETQELPREFVRKKGETLSTWRDRLYHAFRMPTILSALSDLKYPYVEVINPLLSRKLLRQMRQVSDFLRTDKRLFEKIVVSLSPEIEFTQRDSVEAHEDILKANGIPDLLKEEVSSERAKSIFPDDFLHEVLKGIRSHQKIDRMKTRSFSIKDFVKKLMPGFIKKGLRKYVFLPPLDPNTLAFRVFLVSKMNTVLMEDATRINRCDE